MTDMQSASSLAATITAANGDTDRRDRLVAAAHELLDEAGLEGLTVRAVLKRTGLARRAFYESFAGKDDLVLAVFERSLLDAADHFGRLAKVRGNPLEGIRAIVTGLVMGSFDHANEAGAMGERRSAAMAREHLRLAESRPDELHAALSPLLDLIADQVREGIRSGQFRDCDPDLQARLIYNLVSTTVHTVLLAEDCTRPVREHRTELEASIWEFCRRAIVT